MGFDRFVFCLGHLSDQLVNYLNSISEWNDYFTYSIEKEPLGTGGAIINAYSFLEEDFLIINGDNIFLGNYIPAINYYYSSKIKSLIFLRKVKNNGNVMFNRDNKQINLYKRDCSRCLYEDIGVKIFNKRIFEESKLYLKSSPGLPSPNCKLFSGLSKSVKSFFTSVRTSISLDAEIL